LRGKSFLAIAWRGGEILREEEWEGLPEHARLSLAEILVSMLREADPEIPLKSYLGRLAV